MRAGAPSVNPLGRPRGARGLAQYVAEQTRDGQELIDRLLELSRNPETPIRERLAATQAALDRCVGRPLQPSEINLSLEQNSWSPPPGWSLWGPDERASYLAEFRARALQLAAGGDVIDVGGDDEEV